MVIHHSQFGACTFLYLQANYWGLSEDAEGCKPCDCDLGGSVDGSCDQSNGQCTCKPNIVGRRCDQPAQAYFVSNLDYYVYEAEFAEGTGVSTRLDFITLATMS